MTSRARRRCFAVAVAVLIATAGGDASSEAPDMFAPVAGVVPPMPEPLHTLSPATITTDGGSVERVPPGYFLDVFAWTRLDAEVRRLQDSETRLAAENTSLRASAADPSGLTWRVVAVLLGVALAGGITAGAYAF